MSYQTRTANRNNLRLYSFMRLTVSSDSISGEDVRPHFFGHSTPASSVDNIDFSGFARFSVAMIDHDVFEALGSSSYVGKARSGGIHAPTC